MHRWAGVVALFHVGSSKEFHELCDKLRNIGANVLELFHALRYREYLVGDIESDHGYWPGFFKDNRCGFWVSQDIELSSRSHIAGVVPAAHQSDSANTLNQLWVHAREKRDIGQRAGRNNDHGTGFILRDNLGNEVDRVDVF